MEDIRYIVLSSYPSIGPLMQQLSTLLNSTKVLLTDGHRKMHRDWRGLASLINISSEVEAEIASNHQDQTKQVWEIWRKTPGVNLGNLLDHLETLGRYDAYDDIVEFVRQNLPTNQVAVPENHVMVQNNPSSVNRQRAITYYDSPGNYPQFDAFIIYAEPDWHFVMPMKEYLEQVLRFQICTRDDLLPGLPTEIAPVADLITNRCNHVIIVISPDFLKSNENSYYADLTQTDNIKNRNSKMLPLIYRECERPPHLAATVSLRFNSRFFWRHLVEKIDPNKVHLMNQFPPPILPQPPQPQMQIAFQSSMLSELNIVTATNTDRYSSMARNDLSHNHNGYVAGSQNNQVNLDNRQGMLSPNQVSLAHSQSDLYQGYPPYQGSPGHYQVSPAHSHISLVASQAPLIDTQVITESAITADSRSPVENQKPKKKMFEKLKNKLGKKKNSRKSKTEVESVSEDKK